MRFGIKQPKEEGWCTPAGTISGRRNSWCESPGVGHACYSEKPVQLEWGGGKEAEGVWKGECNSDPTANSGRRSGLRKQWKKWRVMPISGPQGRGSSPYPVSEQASPPAPARLVFTPAPASFPPLLLDPGLTLCHLGSTPDLVTHAQIYSLPNSPRPA